MTGHRYRAVARGKRLPASIRSARLRLPVEDLGCLSTYELWQIHDDVSDAHHSTGSRWHANLSLLDLKIELVRRMMQSCCLCERKCGVNRLDGEIGFCGVGTECRYSFEQILWGEEAPLVPSHEIFFTGCNMRCQYCYSWESITDPKCGKKISSDELACVIDKRRAEGAVNVNLIGGEPTVNLLSILLALKFISNPTAVVWNSNFLMSEETMKLLNGIVDLYVADFRFGNDDCANKIAKTDRYFEAASRNLMMAERSGDLIIRHLLLPGHIDCCLRPIASWVAENLPTTPFNLMFQYTPFFGALDDAVLGRCITKEEQKQAIEIVSSFGLNAKRWKRPLKGVEIKKAGSGELTTTITIRPDGQVSVMHLHSDLIDLMQAMERGGE